MNKPDANGRNPMHLTDDEFLNERDVPETMCTSCREIAARVCDEEARRLRLEASEAHSKGQNLIANLLIGRNDTALVCESIIRAIPTAPGEPVAWLVLRSNGSKDVVLSPLTDETFMDEGDEAVPLYSGQNHVIPATPGERTAAAQESEKALTKLASDEKGGSDRAPSPASAAATPSEPVALPEEPEWLEFMRSFPPSRTEFEIVRYMDQLRAAATSRIAELERKLAEAQEALSKAGAELANALETISSYKNIALFNKREAEEQRVRADKSEDELAGIRAGKNVVLSIDVISDAANIPANTEASFRLRGKFQEILKKHKAMLAASEKERAR